MILKREIADHHGRIENIKLFDIDPQHIWKEEKEKELADALAKKEKQQSAAAADNDEDQDEEKKEEKDTKQVEDEGSKYTTYDDDNMTLYDIFKEYGTTEKKECDKNPDFQKTLYYDFNPYNSMHEQPVYIIQSSIYYIYVQ